jgi:hypothetical protein
MVFPAFCHRMARKKAKIIAPANCSAGVSKESIFAHYRVGKGNPMEAHTAKPATPVAK